MMLTMEDQINADASGYCEVIVRVVVYVSMQIGVRVDSDRSGYFSFTGENVVELFVHGSKPVIKGVLQSLSSIDDCRPAEAGEFTERAFDNNKMDLMQVEGLADLLNAETEAQRKQALRQMSGHVGEIFEVWRTEIISCLAFVEAMIDFGDDEDDVSEKSYDTAVDRIKQLANSISSHLDDGCRGEIIRSGLHVAILGAPNAGKSSLLNILAKRPAAIVSPEAGTTRDIIQIAMNIKGFPVLLHDTAGIRDTENAIEKEGVFRALKCIEDSDMKIAVVDVQALSDVNENIFDAIDDRAIVVLNKLDLVDADKGSNSIKFDNFRDALDKKFPKVSICEISCSSGAGIDNFIEVLGGKIEAKLRDGESSVNDSILTRERHRKHLHDCLRYLESFLEDPYQAEIAAEDLRLAVHSLGRILGRVDVEEVLDVLFGDFCIGK